MAHQDKIKPFSKGFSPDDDIFRREEFYEKIMRVVQNAPEDNLVLALDDNWGNGKTTFVEMMKSQIEIDHHEKHNVIYFDAFESDYQTDPFISLTAQIYSMIEQEGGKLKSYCNKFLEASKKVGATLLTNGLKVAINASTAGLVDSNIIEKTGKEIIQKATDSAEAYIVKKITTAAEEKKDIDHFRETLSKMHAETGKSTIFIIDELDRARPDFSLDLIEKVKHLFSVKGVVFILVMNRIQFEKSIEKRYGNIDSRTYLNKFVNYWLTLPKTRFHSITQEGQHSSTTINNFLLKINKKHKLFSRRSSFLSTLSFLLDINDCSLREAERCYALLKILTGSDSVDEYDTPYQVPLAIVIFLKVHDPYLLDNFLARIVSKADLYTKLKLNIQGFSDAPICNVIKNFINYHYLTPNELKTSETHQAYPDYIAYGRQQQPFVEFYQNVQGLSLQ